MNLFSIRTRVFSLTFCSLNVFFSVAFQQCYFHFLVEVFTYTVRFNLLGIHVMKL